MVSPRLVALAGALFIVLWGFVSAVGAGEGEESSAAQGGGAPADSASPRTLVSTDGSVSVFEELVPGEGTDGFWWEFDPAAELERLLDKQRRGEELEPLVDLYGFPLTIPDSIRALRDSVASVADSIRAVTIEVEQRFEPKWKTGYVEIKDDYTLTNDLDVNYPLSSLGTMNVKASTNNTFNQSTRKLRNDRTVTSSFNFLFSERLASSFSVSRVDNEQKRDAVVESNADNTSMTGRVRASNQETRLGGVLLGNVEASAGLSANRRNYLTQVSDGYTEQISPNWNFKVVRPAGASQVSFDYTGNVGRARSKETRTEETKDRNANHKVSASAKYDFDEDTRLQVNGSLDRNRFQFISQADSVAGRQETRQQNSESVRVNLTAAPVERLSFRGSADYQRAESRYELEYGRYSDTVTRSANSEVEYESWPGARWLLKLDRRHEDRNYVNLQAGIVEDQKASLDYKQQITPNVDLNASYFASLRSFKFDDNVNNTGDRDLLSQTGTFTIHYTPLQALRTNVRMEVRKAESINIHPEKSSDNKTDHTYLIRPGYNLKIGKANIDGEFQAEARYAVYDFREDDNFLNRRFSTRQKWQHSLTKTISTEFVLTYEINDEGSYRRSEYDGKRRFSRSRELHRFRVSGEVRYTPFKGVNANFLYRQDGDDTYSVSEGSKTQTGESRTQEFTSGLTFKRAIMDHVSLNLDFRQTQKSGDRVRDTEHRFYNIRASLEYTPLTTKGQGQ
jgi:hypothetical protein